MYFGLGNHGNQGPPRDEDMPIRFPVVEPLGAIFFPLCHFGGLSSPENTNCPPPGIGQNNSRYQPHFSSFTQMANLYWNHKNTWLTSIHCRFRSIDIWFKSIWMIDINFPLIQIDWHLNHIDLNRFTSDWDRLTLIHIDWHRCESMSIDVHHFRQFFL